MSPLTPARCSVQIGRTESAVGKIVAGRPRAHLAPLAGSRGVTAGESARPGTASLPLTAHSPKAIS